MKDGQYILNGELVQLFMASLNLTFLQLSAGKHLVFQNLPNLFPCTIFKLTFL